MLTVADKVLVAVLLALSIVGFAALGFVRAEGATVVVEQDGKVVGRYPLKGERTLVVDGPLGKTQVEIREGAARIVDSPCPQKRCVRMGGIHRVGRVVVCVPNRVLVRIEGKAEKETPDAISG
jgi:hypothetical protein